MKNITETVQRYVSAWNQPTAETVKAALQQCLAANITYTDKLTPLVTGIDAFTDLIMSSHEKFPGRTFSILTEPEYFEGHCYYTWGVNLPGIGERAGRDYVEYNDDSLFARIIGFLPVQP